MLGGSLLAGVALASTPPPYLPFVFGGLGLFVEGVNVSGSVMVNTLTYDSEVGRRGTLSFTLDKPVSFTRLEAGMDVRLVRNSAVLWAGSIERATEKIPLGANILFQSIEATDYNGLADRRLAAASFEVIGQSAGDIASSLVLELLAGDGATLGFVNSGNGVIKAVFSYDKLSTALDELAQTSGFIWYFDEFKRFYFHEAGAILAPFPITDSSAPVRNLEVVRSREQFRSRQYLQAGKAQTDVLVENFAGDSKRRTFTVGFEVALTPSLTVNAVPKTIGVRKVDTGKDFYYALGDKEITQDVSGALLGTIDTLAVTYVGQFPITLDALNSAAIMERQAIEGGSGLYDEADKNENITDSGAALDYASALLRRFSKIPKGVTFETDVDGLKAGMMLTMTMADEQLTGAFLITSVKAGFLDGGQFFRYSVTATDGEFLGGWAEFYRQLENRGKRFTIRENEVASLARSAYDGIQASDSTSFVTAIDDGTNDPYTSLETSSNLEAIQSAFYIGKSNIGKERFDL